MTLFWADDLYNFKENLLFVIIYYYEIDFLNSFLNQYVFQFIFTASIYCYY